MLDHGTMSDRRRRQNIALCVLLGVMLYFLVTEHWAHVVPFLPYVLLLLCPLMHLFMHGGQHGHDDDARKD